VFGAIIGIVVGTALGAAFAASLKQQGITAVVSPGSSLVIFLVLSVVLGLGAASWPARRAAKLDVLRAIATGLTGAAPVTARRPRRVQGALSVQSESQGGCRLGGRPPGPVVDVVVRRGQRAGLDPVQIETTHKVIELVLDDARRPTRKDAIDGLAVGVERLHPDGAVAGHDPHSARAR